MPDPNPLDRPRKRRIMRRFVLDEISGVDQPAQVGALITIMKRQQEQPRQEDPMPTTFNAAVAVIKRRDGCSSIVAMQRAREENYDLFEKHQAAALINKSDDRPDAAVATFSKRVSEIVARDKCPRSVAMQRARNEFPAEYEAYAAT